MEISLIFCEKKKLLKELTSDWGISWVQFILKTTTPIVRKIQICLEYLKLRNFTSIVLHAQV